MTVWAKVSFNIIRKVNAEINKANHLDYFKIKNYVRISQNETL